MKSLTLLFLSTLFTSAASYAQTYNINCFGLNSQAASEPSEVCIYRKEKIAEIKGGGIVLEKIDLTVKETGSPVDLGGGKIWKTIDYSGQSQIFAVKATWHSIMPMTLDWVKNLKTGQTFNHRKYTGARPRPHTQCTGTGPCL